MRATNVWTNNNEREVEWGRQNHNGVCVNENKNAFETNKIKKKRRTNETDRRRSANGGQRWALTLFSSNITLTPDSDGVWRRIRFCWFWFGCCGGSCVCSAVWWTCWSMFMLFCLAVSPAPLSSTFADLLTCIDVSRCCCSNACVLNCCSIRRCELSFIVRFPLESTSSLYGDAHTLFVGFFVFRLVCYYFGCGQKKKKNKKNERREKYIIVKWNWRFSAWVSWWVCRLRVSSAYETYSYHLRCFRYEATFATTASTTIISFTNAAKIPNTRENGKWKGKRTHWIKSIYIVLAIQLDYHRGVCVFSGWCIGEQCLIHIQRTTKTQYFHPKESTRDNRHIIWLCNPIGHRQRAQYTHN